MAGEGGLGPGSLYKEEGAERRERWEAARKPGCSADVAFTTHFAMLTPGVGAVEDPSDA